MKYASDNPRSSKRIAVVVGGALVLFALTVVVRPVLETLPLVAVALQNTNFSLSLASEK